MARQHEGLTVQADAGPPTKKGRPFKALCGIMLYDAEGDRDGATPCLGDYEVL